MALKAIVPTRERILAHARDLYLESGIGGFSMRKVAARARLTATAIYRHYDSREQLLAAVVEEGFQRFAAALWQALAGATPRERLIQCGVQYRVFALANPEYYRVMFLSSARDLGFVQPPEDGADKLAPTFQFLVDRVRECMDDGTLRAGDPVEVAVTIWSHVHGLVSLHLAGRLCRLSPDDGQFAALYDASVDRVLRGLLTS